MKQILPHPFSILRYSCLTFGLLITVSSSGFGQSLQLPDSTTAPTDTLQVTIKPYELNAADFNKGFVYNVEQALIGRFAGLRVTPAGGSPGMGAEMVQRAGTSLFGNNSPLIVVDGILLDFFYQSNHASNLSWLNADDIASVSLLRDAASTALYGGAVANGVLVITTKSGKSGDKMRVHYNASGAASSLRKKANIFSSEEFRDLIQERFPNQQHLLGQSETDWQDEIYRTGLSMAHNLNLSGAVGAIPYRIAVGQVKHNGIVETTGYKRNSVALNLQPSLFQKHLTFKLTLQNTGQEIQLADEKVIPAAMGFDPTQPVYTDNEFGGYFAHISPDGYLKNSQYNPVSMLRQMENKDEVKTLSGQAHIQYRLHFLPSLTVNYRFASFKSESYYSSAWQPNMAYKAYTEIDLNTHALESKTQHNEAFLTLDQPIPAWNSRLKIQVGTLRTNQDNLTESTQGKRGTDMYTRIQKRQFVSENLSYYGSLGYTLLDRYHVNASFRKLSDTRFSYDIARQRAMAVGIGWDVGKEKFLANSDLISLLSLRADVGSFSRLDEAILFRELYLGSFPNGSGGYAIPGSSHDVKLEKTLQQSLGIEFGLYQNRLQGTITYFNNNSTDLLIPFRHAYGSGDRLSLLSIGTLTVSGLETALHYTVYRKGSTYLKLGTHTTLIKNQVNSIGDITKKFSYTDDDFGLALVDGKPAQAFDLYKHLYDGNGKPISGGYDKSEYGYALKYAMGSNQPKTLYGLSANGGYGNWEMSFLVRGAAGHEVFNRADAQRSWLNVHTTDRIFANANRSYLETGLNYAHTESDHFLEKASFLRLEYLQLEYNVGKMLGTRMDFRINATAQNAFVLTRYSGQDPEFANGIDNGQYPQPRTFSLGLNLSI